MPPSTEFTAAIIEAIVNRTAVRFDARVPVICLATVASSVARPKNSGPSGTRSA